MHTIIAEKDINAPIEKIWALVSDFANLDWYSGAEKVEHIPSTKADRSGEIRRIYMPGMADPVDEILETIDANQHRISYQIPGSPMAGYQVEVSLTTNSDQSTHAKWHATFTHVTMEGLTSEMMVEMVTKTYAEMLVDVEKAVS